MELSDFQRIITVSKYLNHEFFEWITDSVDYTLDFDDTRYDSILDDSVITPNITWTVSLRFDKDLKYDFMALWKETFKEN